MQIARSEEEWRAALTPAQFATLRQAITEAPRSSPLCTVPFSSACGFCFCCGSSSPAICSPATVERSQAEQPLGLNWCCGSTHVAFAGISAGICRHFCIHCCSWMAITLEKHCPSYYALQYVRFECAAGGAAGLLRVRWVSLAAVQLRDEIRRRHWMAQLLPGVLQSVVAAPSFLDVVLQQFPPICPVQGLARIKECISRPSDGFDQAITASTRPTVACPIRKQRTRG